MKLEAMTMAVQHMIGNVLVEIMESKTRFFKEDIIEECVTSEKLKELVDNPDIGADGVRETATRWIAMFEYNYMIKQIEGTNYWRKLSQTEMREAFEAAKDIAETLSKQDDNENKGE